VKGRGLQGPSRKGPECSVCGGLLAHLKSGMKGGTAKGGEGDPTHVARDHPTLGKKDPGGAWNLWREKENPLF